MHLVKFESIGTHCIALHVKAENVIYFDSFGVEYVPNKLEN